MNTDDRSEDEAPPLMARVVLPPLSPALEAIWDLILDIGERVPAHRWQLVGGQMVMLHGLAAGRNPLRASRDVDVLADLLTRPDGVRLCLAALRELRFEPVPDSGGRLVYRFRRTHDGSVVDLLAPDHTPPRWSLRTIAGKDTIRIDGGRQALHRPASIQVAKGGRQQAIPVPDHLGALILKAAAWRSDNRDRERHSGDAAFLTSLITDPIHERTRFGGSDRKRLNALDKVLGDAGALEWAALGDYGRDAHTTWKLLLSG